MQEQATWTREPDRREDSMMRKAFVAATAVLFTVGMVMGEEFSAVIKKVDGNKVTLAKTKRGKKGTKGTTGEDVVLTAVDSVKVVKGKFNRETKKFEAGDAITDGLKNEMFTKGNVRGRVITNDSGDITEIRVGGGRGGKKKKKKADTE
jgi:hypothetical protein